MKKQSSSRRYIAYYHHAPLKASALNHCLPAANYCVHSVVIVIGTPLLLVPLTVTTTLPEVEPVGTLTTMKVSLHELGEAATPLKLTVLDPCVAPKETPSMTTAEPVVAGFGEMVVMVGAAELFVTENDWEGSVMVGDPRVAPLFNLKIIWFPAAYEHNPDDRY